ncbi:26S proteasome regulatory subunit 6A [Bonamia ostreae]|uniref:26S proteasome regulatory subunit 6A n=1 Tax=Bonamia ostreae TaxID=126728 RepID=A0ABV2AF98_9EUKA
MANQILTLDKIPEAERTKLESLSALNNILGKDSSTIKSLVSMLRTNVHIMNQDISRFATAPKRLKHEHRELDRQIKENKDKLKINSQLPYIVSDVVELLDIDPFSEADGGDIGEDKPVRNKCAVIKTSARQTIFLPVIGTVPVNDLEPGERVGANKDSYLVLDKLPAEYDSRVKAFEMDEKPTEDYNDVGGLDKQIEELYEAVVLPITSLERFKKVGIRPPKGVLLHGPPGTGKTLLARACAAKTNACFLKISAPQLVQMYTGDGARIVRDVFKLASEKGNCIIFIGLKYSFLLDFLIFRK